jgi:hypothetical protein
MLFSAAATSSRSIASFSAVGGRHRVGVLLVFRIGDRRLFSLEEEASRPNGTTGLTVQEARARSMGTSAGWWIGRVAHQSMSENEPRDWCLGGDGDGRT